MEPTFPLPSLTGFISSLWNFVAMGLVDLVEMSTLPLKDYQRNLETKQLQWKRGPGSPFYSFTVLPIAKATGPFPPCLTEAVLKVKQNYLHLQNSCLFSIYF